MPVPTWALFAISAWLLLFGAFRIAIAVRGRRREREGGDAPRSIFALTWRRHLIFGVFYILVGAYVAVMAFGYGIPGAMQPDEPVSLPSQRPDHLIID